MSNISVTDSTYGSGGVDTRSTLDGTSPATFQQMNGAASAVIAIETVIGDGSTLKGSTPDLATRLAIEHNTDGSQKTVPVSKGGTGVVTLTDGAVLVGNSVAPVTSIALPTKEKVLTHTGIVGTDPFWQSGLLFHGPSSMGPGSTRSHESSLIIASNSNLSGIHFYTDFTLNAGVTLTVSSGTRRVVIIASGTITINGTITAVGAGGPAVGAGSIGNGGTDQPGGGGTQGEGSNPAGAGGPVGLHGFNYQAGGAAGGGSQHGSSATPVIGSDTLLLANFTTTMGGASGGGGDTGLGGAGGGSIVLIAPQIILGSTSVLNTSGNAGGSVGSFQGAGGGGGAGNIYILTRLYTNNGVTFTQNGGAGGIGGASFVGGSGANGVKQILIYE